jgi:D-glycero-alpha-D-manno-heptose-7-phosphate kinase
MGRQRALVIITQTPLRIGLVGGGTDLPDYYREHGGRVLNAAIDKYVYVIVKQRFDDDLYVNYSQKEIVTRVEEVRHDLVREAMYMTGVGSSSSVTVGLLHALFTYQGRQVSAAELAERACTIELDRCRKPIGKQDQYAAAYGGLCDLTFGPGDRVEVDQLHLAKGVQRRLQSELLLFYTGITRRADTILREQSANIGQRLEELHLLRGLAAEASEGLRGGDTGAVGVALSKSWEAKRSLAAGVSNTQLDAAVEAALLAGATGAKVAGAGGGGFVLVCCPVEHQRSVRHALADMKELPITFDPLGSRVIFNVHRDIWG